MTLPKPTVLLAWTSHRVVPHSVQISWSDQHRYPAFENHEGWGSRFLIAMGKCKGGPAPTSLLVPQRPVLIGRPMFLLLHRSH